MLILGLPVDIEKELEVLSRKSGRTKDEFACAGLVTFMEDMEDVALAEARLKNSG